jgi:hypothetical protein
VVRCKTAGTGRLIRCLRKDLYPVEMEFTALLSEWHRDIVQNSGAAGNCARGLDPLKYPTVPARITPIARGP